MSKSHAHAALGHVLDVWHSYADRAGHAAPQPAEAMSAQALGNLSVWLASEPTVYAAVERFLPGEAQHDPDDTRPDLSMLPSLLAMVAVATRVDGLPRWAEARKVARTMESQILNNIMSRCCHGPKPELETAVREQLPKMFARTLETLARLPKGVHTGEARALTADEQRAIRHLGDSASAHLGFLLYCNPQPTRDVSLCLERFYETTRKETTRQETMRQETMRQETTRQETMRQETTRQSDSDSDSEVDENDRVHDRVKGLQDRVVSVERALLEAKGRAVNAITICKEAKAHAAEARARAAGAEQICDEAKKALAAAEKRVCAAEKAVRVVAEKAEKRVCAAEKAVRVKAPDLEDVRRTAVRAEAKAVAAADTVADAHARAAAAEAKAADADSRAAAAEAKAADAHARAAAALARAADADTQTATAFKVLAALEARLKTLEASKEATERHVDKLQGEMAWLLPQFHHRFVCDFNALMMQWHIQQSARSPYVSAPAMPAARK